jgi:8-oxo-dGTP pyrophosphatase MutT (NUDIX family)
LAKKIAYGGVVFDEEGRVLLRKPRGEYDGYKWTFAKGRPNQGETPEQAALREVREEAGVDAEIFGQVPGNFEGGTTVNRYFLIRSINIGHLFDKETEKTCWATCDEARKLISQTTNARDKERDLAVFDAAVALYGRTVHS